MLSIPEPVWDTLLDAFATAPPGHERIAYLDGIRLRDRGGAVHGVATTVTVPDAVTTAHNYRISAEAMAQAGEHFTPLGLVRLAQVHTHGGRCTQHSPTDDARTYSQLDGALSLVLAHHAAGRPPPAQARVHIREPGGWRRASPGEATHLVRLVPGLIDHRSRKWSASPTATKATWVAALNPLRRPGRWLSRWWSRQRRRT